VLSLYAGIAKKTHTGSLGSGYGRGRTLVIRGKKQLLFKQCLRLSDNGSDFIFKILNKCCKINWGLMLIVLFGQGFSLGVHGIGRLRLGSGFKGFSRHFELCNGSGDHFF